MTAQRAQFGPWEKLESLGKGGQGEVFLARKASTNTEKWVDTLLETVKFIGSVNSAKDKERKAAELLSVIRAVSLERDTPGGALKILHSIADKSASEKAVGRMKQELAALGSFQHPALVQVRDSNPEERWFVMEYFSRGTLSGHLGRTRGDLLASLVAFRPLVEAVATLHEKGFVHRDIKADNVFVADDGHLVLGDFGLVINPGAADVRLTDTYENVGSRDWMPAWAMGKRLDDVKPNFDVFSLGKLLWSMVSGRQFLRLWYYAQPEFDLEKLLPNSLSIRWAKKILAPCIVEHERDCLPNASKLLASVDLTIDALKHGAQVLRKNQELRCWLCGLGSYLPVHMIPPEERNLTLSCNYCGNVQTFLNVKDMDAWR